MDFSLVFISGFIMLLLGSFLALGLAYANKRFFIKENALISEIEALLSGANCGACGEAGCHALAEAIVAGKKAPECCLSSKAENLSKIAELLGKEINPIEKKVARIACSGGNDNAVRKAKYVGLHGCRAALLASGGGKACVWGCIGFGDCVEACSFNALSMSKDNLPLVDENLCVGCGICTTTCPQQLISLQNINNRLWIACNNHDKGTETRKVCNVGCLGCGLCTRSSEAISIKDNLAKIDYAKQPAQKITFNCPTGAIGYFNENGYFIKSNKVVTDHHSINKKSSG